MHIDLLAIGKDLLTVASAAKLACGALLHKVWSKLVGAEKKLAAEVAKLESDAAAAAKKL
jgi:hypothetical protein